MADAFAGVAIEPRVGLPSAFRRDPHLDRGDEERVADLDHALRVEGPERQRHGPYRRPRGVAGEFDDAFGDRVARRGRRDLCEREGDGDRERDPDHRLRRT